MQVPWFYQCNEVSMGESHGSSLRQDATGGGRFLELPFYRRETAVHTRGE